MRVVTCRRSARGTTVIGIVGALTLAACAGDDAATSTTSPPATIPTTTAATTAPETTAAPTTPPDTTGAPETTQATTTTVANTSNTVTTVPSVEALRILLVNDDGVDNPAIDYLLSALVDEPDIELTVVAPSEERSGTSDNLTDGPIEFREVTTPAGAAAWSVDGFPADSVVVALDQLGLEPHLVVSGINPGQNIGPFAAISGTVGVGRTAIRRGIPALAVSGPLELDDEQFEFATQLAVEWIREHRDALVAGAFQADTVTSINVPDCPAEQMGPLTAVPRALEFVPEGLNPFLSSCDLSDPEPGDDVAALIVGYPTITDIPADLD